jgi:hypothetical protein
MKRVYPPAESTHLSLLFVHLHLLLLSLSQHGRRCLPSLLAAAGDKGLHLPPLLRQPRLSTRHLQSPLATTAPPAASEAAVAASGGNNAFSFSFSLLYPLKALTSSFEAWAAATADIVSSMQGDASDYGDERQVQKTLLN